MSMTPAEMREMAAKKAEIFTLGMPRDGSRRLIAAIRAIPIPDTTAADEASIVEAMLVAANDACNDDDEDHVGAIRAAFDVARPMIAKAAAATLPCGHHHSLGVRNIESNVVSCELCEARDELRDALTMERELGDKARNQRDALEKAREALSACIHDTPGWSKRAREALATIDAAKVKVDIREVAEAFEPCRLDNPEGGIIQWIWRDTPHFAKPVFPSVHHFLDDLVAMDDGKVIGVQFWEATDVILALGEPK